MKAFDVDLVISGDDIPDALALTELLIAFVELHGWEMGGLVKEVDPFEGDDPANAEVENVEINPT